MRGIRELVSVLEGGKGSGHWSHSGRIGLVGGSTKGKRPKPAFMLSVEDIDHVERTDFQHFSSQDGRDKIIPFMRYMDEDRNIKVLRDAAGRIQAAVLYELSYSSTTAKICGITSNVEGGGRRLMALVCQEAVRVGRGIELESMTKPLSFYQHLGMICSGKHCAFTKEMADAFSFRTIKRQR